MAERKLVCVEDFEEYAKKHLPKMVYDYYSSGANEQNTLRENKGAFSRLRLRPRLLRDVSCLDTSTSLLGERVSSPIGLSPTAMQRMAHHEGEIASARAAESMDMCMILSSWATSTIEEVAEAGHSLHWFQLYLYKDRSVSKDLVKRAERAGYKAIALTVDTPVLGRRVADARNHFELPRHLSLANYDQTDVHALGVTSKTDSGLATYVANLIDNKLTWEDVRWLKSITSLPIILKGILTAEDAKMAVDVGADGIMVSNHGGRQLDGVPATIEALPEVVEAVAGRVEVFLDGGVRQGTDVLKALALGAKAVFVGRPVLWGLAYQGQSGVEEVLTILQEELKTAMALSGCRSIADITKSLVVHESWYDSKL